MKLPLRRCWDGTPAPSPLGGEMHVALEGGALDVAWDVMLTSAPRIPSAPPGYVDGLWEHDVVELFLTTSSADDGAPRYVEIEVGPAAHWLALWFEGRRRRADELRRLSPRIVSQAEGGRWTGTLRADVSSLPAGLLARPGLRGLACLVSTVGGERVHLCSSALPGTQADFHQPESWPLLTGVRAASPGR